MGTESVVNDPGLEYDPTDYDQQDDPYPLYRRLRDEAPCYHNERLGFYALSRYGDVLAAATDWRRYSSAAGIALDVGPSPMIITMDPPRQTYLRGLVARSFTRRRIGALEPVVRRLARRLAEELPRHGTVDIVTGYTDILPMAVMAAVLGAPEADRPFLQDVVTRSLEQPAGQTSESPEAGRASRELERYCAELVAARRAAPADDLVGGLLAQQGEPGSITDAELVGFCKLLVVAGYETTTKLIGTALYWLARFPDQRRRLCEDPAAIPGALEEVLRYDGPTPLMARRLTADLELHGTRMPAGAQVLLLFACANRDERRWPDPDVFDVARDTEGHLGFGHGVHFCLGAALARLEGRVALEELLPRLGDYSVDTDRAVRARTRNNRGFLHLPLVL